MVEDLSNYCASNTKIKEEIIAVSENVSLRVITFTPAVENNNHNVVFIPGWISLITGWREVLLEMTKDFTVYYVETREKISSIITGITDFSVETIGKDIVSIITKLGLQDKGYILFGSSLGATAILDCCKSLEVNPLCLILVGPNAVFRIPYYGKILIKIFRPSWYNFVKPYIKWYLKTFRLDAKSDYEQYEKYCGVLDSADPWKLKKAALAVSKYEVWNKLEEIEYPTLVIGASKDKLHEPENLKKIVSMTRNTEYLDMETNKNAHSKKIVEAIREYILKLC